MAIDPVSIAVQVTLAAASYALKALLTPDQNIEGPRRDDLSVTAVQPGNAIPRPFGTTVAPGQVIAQSELIETANTTSQSAKGGPSVSNTDYTYAVHIAVGFSARDVTSVTEIRASEKVIWSAVGNVNYTDEEIAANKAARYSETYNARYASYISSGYSEADAVRLAEADAEYAANLLEEQQSAAGDDTQPYFDDIEIFYGTEDQEPSAILEEIEGAGNVPAYRGTAYFVLKNFQLADFGNGIPDFKVILNAGAASSVVGGGGAVEVVESSGVNNDLVIGAGAEVTYTFQNTLQENDVVLVFFSASPTSHSTTDFVTPGYIDTFYEGYLTGTSANPWKRVYLKRMGASPDTSVTIENTRGSGTYNHVIVIVRNAHTDNNQIFYGGDIGDQVAVVSDLNSTTHTPGTTTPADRNDLTVLFVTYEKDDTDGFGNPGLIWDQRGYSYSTGVASANTIGVWTSEPDEDLSSKGSAQLSSANDDWGSINFTIKAAEAYSAPVTVPGGTTSIGEIIRASITEWEPDVSPMIEGNHFTIASELDDMTVQGATFTRLSSVREIAEICALWRPIQWGETGDKIRFLKRDGPALADVDGSHYRAREAGTEDPGASVITRRVDDVDLPREVRIKYLNVNRDYSGDAAQAKIVDSRAYEVVTHSLPIVGDPEEAKRAAVMVLMEHYATRRSYEFDLPRQYAIMETGDQINIPANNDDLQLARIARLEIGADFTLKLQAFDHVDSEDSVALTAETFSVTSDTNEGVLSSIAYVIDTARLTDDSDLDDGSQLIVGVGGRSASWRGGSIYLDKLSGESLVYFGQNYADPSETDYELQHSFTTMTHGGRLVTAPNSAADEFVVDRASVMDVSFDTYNPVFANLSNAQFNKRVDNVFAVGSNSTGWEIIQAQTAQLIGTNLYRFSNLRRGMRGTEWMIPLHTVESSGSPTIAGDQVIHINPAAVARVAFSDAQIGNTLAFRAVSTGQTIGAATTKTVTVTARQRKLFAPNVTRAYRDASDNITATLRGRALQADSSGLHNLASTANDYEVDIYDGPQSGSPTLLRTITLTDSTSLSYTAAQQTTDFGSPQTAVHALLYQLDADGVRGYSREVIL